MSRRKIVRRVDNPDTCPMHPRKRTRSYGVCAGCIGRLRQAVQRFDEGRPTTPRQLQALRAIKPHLLRARWPHIEQVIRAAELQAERNQLASSPKRKENNPRRQSTAYHLRAREGWEWDRISRMLGYENKSNAHRAARRYAKSEQLPWPPVAP